MKYKLGKRPKLYNPQIPHMSALFKLAAPYEPPITCDYSFGMPDDFGMFLNDSIGNCTAAAYYHALQVWSFNAKKLEITESDDKVLSLYESSTGYNPNDPTTDQGGVESDVLTYIMNNGAPINDGVDKIAAFLEVDYRNLDDLRRTIVECGVAYIGINMTQKVMDNADDNTITWDTTGDQTSLGGHAIILVAYDVDTFTCISWGKRYKLTHGFLAQNLEEAYAIASYDWIDTTGRTPLGMSLNDLEFQMRFLKE